MTDIFSYLKDRPYPGRGILLGATPDGQTAIAYFIMGRSENSRNRVFETTEDGIRTRAADDAKMTDPSLIIYHPVRRVALDRGVTTVVTNGDQTDTVRDSLLRGDTWIDALRTRAFEPDAPNWTPRVSGVVMPDGSYSLSILKARDGEPDCCQRFYYTYDAAIKGVGHFISTYEGFGGPLPSFSGEPVSVSLPQMDAKTLADALWDALNADNRVSLYVRVGEDEVVLNRFTRKAE